MSLVVPLLAATLCMLPRLIPIDELYKGKPNEAPDCFTAHGIRTNLNLTNKIMRQHVRRQEYLNRTRKARESRRSGFSTLTTHSTPSQRQPSSGASPVSSSKPWRG